MYSILFIRPGHLACFRAFLFAYIFASARAFVSEMLSCSSIRALPYEAPGSICSDFFCDPVKFLPAVFFLLRFPEQDAELISADPVTVSIAGIRLFQTFRDHLQALVPRLMTVCIVDVLKIVEVEDDQHLILRLEVPCPVQIALLA